MPTIAVLTLSMPMLYETYSYIATTGKYCRREMTGRFPDPRPKVAEARGPGDPNTVDEISIDVAVTLVRWFGHEAQHVYAETIDGVSSKYSAVQVLIPTEVISLSSTPISAH